MIRDLVSRMFYPANPFILLITTVVSERECYTRQPEEIDLVKLFVLFSQSLGFTVKALSDFDTLSSDYYLRKT